MKTMIAAAALAFAVAGSAFGPVGSAAFAATEPPIDQVIVDNQGLSNTWSTLDNEPSNVEPQSQPEQSQPEQSPPDRCGCLIVPADAPSV